VVTRIPVSHRITIQEAVRRIQENFSSVELAACTASRYWDLLDEMAARDVFGGRLYDSLIARTVVDAGVTLLLTWNARHFRQVAPPGLEIREP
jgi:predicted nucleic acid-binding protein